MSDKPSLYVVEKKEVVILVVLFVIVTVLSFTMGVRYGESVGKKSAIEMSAAENEHAQTSQEAIGGTLGTEKKEAVQTPNAIAEKKTEHADATHKSAEHGEAAAGGAAAAKGSAPEVAAVNAGETEESEPNLSAKEAVDKNSDEYLLNALKESGVEPPKGAAAKSAKLPDEVKKVPAGTYVIQVGSHPTRSEAQSQVRSLKTKKVEAQILAPFKDRQGEWHRVVVGSFKNKRDADKEAKAMKSRGAVISYFVWRLP